MRRLSALIGAVPCLLALAACSMVPSGPAMTFHTHEPVRGHDASAGLGVEGGGGLKYRISNAAFEEAVTTSLVEAHLFSRLVRIADADYRLDAILGDCRQPAGGANMTTVMTVLWSLSRVASGETVWQALIESEYTATIGDAFAGAVRMRKATEGAARKNIEEAIRRIAAADLAPQSPSDELQAHPSPP